MIKLEPNARIVVVLLMIVKLSNLQTNLKLQEMKKETKISIGLLILGFIFELLYFSTDITLFNIKFWILGTICIVAGALGLIIFGILPLLNRRASMVASEKKRLNSED